MAITDRDAPLLAQLRDFYSRLGFTPDERCGACLPGGPDVQVGFLCSHHRWLRLEGMKLRDPYFDLWQSENHVGEFDGYDAGHVEAAFAAGRDVERALMAQEGKKA